MRDRIPTQVLGNGAVRMEQFDEDGNSLGYIWMKRADEPEEEGTPYNVNNMLTDDTAAAIGLNVADNPTPNDAFSKITDILRTKATKAENFTSGNFIAFNENGDLEDSGQKVAALIKYTRTSYIGNGKHGTSAANATVISFDFSPDFVVIVRKDNGNERFFAVRGQKEGRYTIATTAVYITLTWEEKALRLNTSGASNAAPQLNENGAEYFVYALGV